MKKIFVSSTIYDLTDVRSEIHEFLAKNGFIPIMSDYEDFPDDLSKNSTYTKCLDAVKNADYFLLILNQRYGGSKKISEGELSITHQEFREALKLSAQNFICFVRDEVMNDYKTWKNTGKKNNCEGLSFLHGEKNWRILQIIDELYCSSKEHAALWIETFSNSIELKRKLAIKLGINDFSSNYLAQAQMLQALPKLNLSINSTQCINNRTQYQVSFHLHNMGSSSANHIILNGKLKIGSLPCNGGEDFPLLVPVSSAPTKMSFRFSNILGSVFEEIFSVSLSNKFLVSEEYFGAPIN